MKWFEGTIPEAIASAKAKKAVFVVFIEGKDDASQEVARSLNSPEVSSCLESEKFVAIKLQSDSENYTFFAQIYQFVPVPSIFFIGDNGTPLEIIGNSLPPVDLKTKIDSILAKANPNSSNTSTNLIEAEQKAHSSENNQTSETESKISSEINNTNNDGAASGNVESSAAQSAEDKAAFEISQEEKLKRARELIEVQKKKKQEEEEKKEREREIERRKVGRDLQKLRQQQQDKDIKDAQQERLREKAAEQAAREKILKQIAEDKLERKRKHEKHLQEKNDQLEQKKIQEEAKAKAKAQAASVDMSKTRIQFKLPNGSPILGTFDSTSTLESLRSYVLQNAQLPFRQFSMSAFFPRKDFTAADDNKTLLELNLAPSSVILILPVKSNIPTSVIKSSDGSGIFSHFFWTLLAPVMSIYNYVMGYFTGRPSAGDSSNNENRNSGNSANSDSAGASFGRLPDFGVRRLDNQGAKIRARGNIHSLRADDNDNDENNTWNGNSTQQM
ncbi:UBX domain-containing protein 4 [Copidosoma floridanum]|uniref:UBX domain-containing protein 4 n=1 Tax=Copidosoma floridanum TaxID=29053 RepID=UPI0006C96005|nr:UBX domain-containing protein 4 [Copidosoma floridanum]